MGTRRFLVQVLSRRLLNLSLEMSANIQFSTVKSYHGKQVVSAENGGLTPLDEEHGHRLLAGHGVYIKLE